MSQFEELLKDYPAFLSTPDLVDLGLYNSIESAYLARKNKVGPNFLKMDRKILYPKQSVINFLEERMVKSSE